MNHSKQHLTVAAVAVALAFGSASALAKDATFTLSSDTKIVASDLEDGLYVKHLEASEAHNAFVVTGLPASQMKYSLVAAVGRGNLTENTLTMTNLTLSGNDAVLQAIGALEEGGVRSLQITNNTVTLSNSTLAGPGGDDDEDDAAIYLAGAGQIVSNKDYAADITPAPKQWQRTPLVKS